jgi:hypothetical protein
MRLSRARAEEIQIHKIMRVVAPFKNCPNISPQSTRGRGQVRLLPRLIEFGPSLNNGHRNLAYSGSRS